MFNLQRFLFKQKYILRKIRDGTKNINIKIEVNNKLFRNRKYYEKIFARVCCIIMLLGTYHGKTALYVLM